MANKKLKTAKVPNLRFPGFEGEWNKLTISDVALKVNSGKTPFGGEAVYLNEGVLFIRSQNINNNKLEIEKPVFISEEMNSSMKNSIVLPNDILLNITGASLGRSCVVPNDFSTGNVNQHVCIIRLNKDNNPRFIQPILASQKGQNIFLSLQTGSGREGLNFESIKKMQFFFPDLKEQSTIASFLSFIDERITTQSKIIEDLRLLKHSFRNRLFEEILKKESRIFLIRDLLEYEQPTKYLVSNTDYSSDKLLTPVLTANKAFILGYTDEKFGIHDESDCIIFDDFTMDFKYVNFRFKVKSSAIKILKSKTNINLKFIFEYLFFLKLESNEHKRHYISEIEPMEIVLPNTDVQNRIANFLSRMDERLNLEISMLNLYNQQKDYLLKNLFI